MTGRKRTWTLLLLGVAIVAIVILSVGLSGLELRPGQPFSLGRNPPVPKGSYSIGGGSVLLTVIRVFFIIIILFLPFAIIQVIVSPKARKQLLRQLVSLLPLFILLHYLMTRAQFNVTGEQVQPLDMSLDTPTLAPAVAFTPNPPPWLTVATSLGLAVLMAMLLFGVLWLVWRHRYRPKSPLEQLAQEAQDALDALLTGADLKNVVMRCYFEMARVLNEQRGIKRQRDMTPREFRSRLEEAGLPGEPIRQLTRLFEEVRYGTKVPSEGEEHQAIVCLTAIVEACRSFS
jgi:hypothetical protein